MPGPRSGGAPHGPHASLPWALLSLRFCLMLSRPCNRFLCLNQAVGVRGSARGGRIAAMRVSGCVRCAEAGVVF